MILIISWRENQNYWMWNDPRSPSTMRSCCNGWPSCGARALLNCCMYCKLEAMAELITTEFTELNFWISVNYFILWFYKKKYFKISFLRNMKHRWAIYCQLNLAISFLLGIQRNNDLGQFIYLFIFLSVCLQKSIFLNIWCVYPFTRYRQVGW